MERVRIGRPKEMPESTADGVSTGYVLVSRREVVEPTRTPKATNIATAPGAYAEVGGDVRKEEAFTSDPFLNRGIPPRMGGDGKEKPVSIINRTADSR